MATWFVTSAILAYPSLGFGATTYTGSVNENIAGARIASSDLFESSCPGYWGCTVSQIGCGAPPPIYTTCFLNVTSQNCEILCPTTITWYPNICQGVAILVFS